MADLNVKIGSITADIDLKNDKFMASAQQVIKTSEEVVARVNKQFNQIGVGAGALGIEKMLNSALASADKLVVGARIMRQGSFLEAMGLDPDSLSRGLSASSKVLAGFAAKVPAVFKGVVTDISKELPPVFNQASMLGMPALTKMQAFTQGVKNTFRDVATTAVGALGQAFSGLQSVASGALSAIATGAKSLLSPLSAVKNFIFSINGLLSGFVGWTLITRANQFEMLTDGFTKLTASVGSLSSTMLTKLRAATRGTVSDMELMRSTNNAVQFGIVKSEDQWARLAEAGRRLGQSVGRSTKDAMQDLALGIGRQSRLILDNIGLIVKVEDSQRAYAIAIGKTVDSLTEEEKRTAFFTAVMKAIDLKMLQLGKDTDLTAQSWARLTASMLNFWDRVGVAINGAALPELIGAVINNIRKPVLAFMRFIRNTIGDVYDIFKKLTEDVSSGKATLSDAFQQAFKFIASAIDGIVTVSMTILTETLIAITPSVINVLWAFFKDVVDSAVARALKYLQDTDFYKAMQSAMETAASMIPKQGFGAGSMGGGGYPATTDNSRVVQKIKEEGEFTADAIREAQKKIPEALAQGAPAIASAVKRAQEQLGIAGGSIGAEFTKKLTEGFQKMKFDATSSLRDMKGMVLTSAVQPLANLFDGLVEGVSSFLQKMPSVKAALRNLYADYQIDDWKQGTYTKGLIPPMADIQLNAAETGLVRGSEAVLGVIRNIIEAVNKATFATQKWLRGTDWDAAAAQAMAPYKKTLADLRKEMENVGLTTGDKRIREFTAAMVDLKDKVSPAMAADIAKVLEQFTIVGEALDAKKSVEEYKKALEELEESLLKLSLDKTPVSLDSLNSEIEKQIAEIKVKLASFAGLKEHADRIGPGEGGYISIGATENIRRAIEGLQKEIEDVDFDSLTQGLTETEKVAWKNDYVIADIVYKLGVKAPAAIALMRKSMETLGTSDLQNRIAKITGEIDKKIKELQNNAKLEYYGIPQEFLGQLQVMDQAIQDARDKNDADALKSAIQVKDRLMQLIGAISFGQLTKEVFTAVATGLTDAFARGEKISKAWAQIVSDIFRTQMSKAIERIGQSLEAALSALFAQLGAGSGIGAIGGGLVAIGAMILSNLNARKTSTVEDFSDAINSSEAIRGVVAGPTNIAISKIGEQLKTALFTTEMLLERIARGVEFGGTGGQSNGTLNSRNMAYPLTSSS